MIVLLACVFTIGVIVYLSWKLSPAWTIALYVVLPVLLLLYLLFTLRREEPAAQQKRRRDEEHDVG